MRLIMMGTGPFAVPTLRRLYDSPHEIPLVVTRPTGDVRGKSAEQVNPIRFLAQASGTPVFEPASINDPASHAVLAELQADLFVVCDYGQILTPATLALARLGGINLHASLLPKYRGAAPINWAIYHGEHETGVTVLHMDSCIDAGPALLQAKLPIGPQDTAAAVEPRLAELGAPLVLEAAEALAANRKLGVIQDASLATKAPRLKKQDGLIDWRRSARAIGCQVRAFDPWPKAYTFFQREGAAAVRLILEQVALETDAAAANPGTVLEASGDRLVVGAGEGALRLLRVQAAGKRAMTAGDFLRGNLLMAGSPLYREQGA